MNTPRSPVLSPQQVSQQAYDIRNNVKHRFPRQRIIPRTRSTLPVVDRKFVEFTRCLYQAKTIVQDLSSFHASILPTLSLSPQQRVGFAAFLQHIKKYLDDTFTKFTKLCKLLMLILSWLKCNMQVKPERIQSFRKEIMEEWIVANDIKQQIYFYIHQSNHSSGSAISSSSSSSIPTTIPCDFLHTATSPSTRQQGTESINYLL